MAKILDKFLPSDAKRTANLYHKYDWLKVELDTVEDAYNEKKQITLSKFSNKANSKIVGAAYDACDKAEYFNALTEKKKQEYDVKKYLTHRAINHKAAKAIFKAIRANQDYTAAIELMKKENEAFYEKRELFIKKLDEKREKLLAGAKTPDSAKYDALAKDLTKEREKLEKSIDEKNASLIERDKAKLEAKLAKIKEKLDVLESGITTKYSNPDDVILSIKGLKMYFGGLKAVDDLTFDVKKGEIFGLIGPNGAGKTTVFNCITQFYKPTGGEILFTARDGKTVALTDYNVHDVVLKGIARTFQNIEVVKEVSVLENLLIAATRSYTSGLFVQMLHLPILKREEKVIRQRADKVLKYMDLYAYRDRLAWGLPYGVLKRIEIARALMCNPQLIILDEPAAGLNESETADLAELINRIREDFDCTILLVEHDMSLVMDICDHICAISFGKKLAYGTAEEIQSSKEVQEAYLGSGGE